MLRPSKHARPEDHDNPEPKRRAFQCETSRENQSPESGKDDAQNCAQSIESDGLDRKGDRTESNNSAPSDSIQESDSASQKSDETQINDRDSYDETETESSDTDGYDTDDHDTEIDGANCRIDTQTASLSPEQLEVAEAIFSNVFNKVQAVVRYAKCRPLPANRIPPKKRMRIRRVSPNSTTNDSVKMYYLFACPFYKYNSVRYEECINR